MTRALIAEDEPILAQTLVDTLGRLWPALQLLPLAPNGVQALEAAMQHRPEVMFLDIRMPGKSGLEVAADLAEEWPLGQSAPPFPLLVFVTAYDEYAIQAFEQAAADYVLKPVSDTRLQSTVERLQQRLKSRTADGGLEQVLQQLRRLDGAVALPTAATAPRLQMLRAGVGNEIRMIPVSEVLYFEAGDKYVNVVTARGESLVRTPLRELLAQLDPDQFWQVHRATVVNLAAVEAAERDDSGKLRLRLTGHERRLPVSRLYAHLFRQM